jgi:hypothetical protein
MSSNSFTIAEQAQRIYDERLRGQLERSHPHAFVAIEPVSGDFYLGQTLSEAVSAARKEHPDRLVHTMRVGHKSAVHLGACGP